MSLFSFFPLPSGGDSVNVNAETATMKSVSGGKDNCIKILDVREWNDNYMQAILVYWNWSIHFPKIKKNKNKSSILTSGNIYLCFHSQ